MRHVPGKRSLFIWCRLSETDDRYAITTLEGSLSIVVPLFGFCSMDDFRSCAVYRLEAGEWSWIAPRVVDHLIRIV